MKRILLSLLTISLVSAVAFGATKAYFTDVESKTGNTFATGTIDIAVDGHNPWAQEQPFEMADMKPSQTDYANFVIHNVGTNPANIFKTLKNFQETSTEDQSQSKCLAIGGTWNETTCSGGTPPTDLSSRIHYDLRVELYQLDPSIPTNPQQPYWWETIYLDSDEVPLGSLSGKDMYLGMIPADHYMKVIQSYHMFSGDNDNKYQGEKLTFDISLLAEQLTNKVVLEDKYLADTDVSHHVWNLGGISDGKDATLEYKVKDNVFGYKFDVEGMVDGDYTLVAWQDPLLTWTWGSFGGTTILANVPVSGNVAHLNSSIDLKKSLINAKVWLVPGNLGTPGTNGVALPWNPTSTLFETGLMDYYYTGI